MAKMRVEVWSDIACPWCYVGKRRLEAALERFPERAEVEVRWRAFELDPSAPRERDPGVPYARALAAKYRTSEGRAQQMIDQMRETARQDGLDFHFERARPGNTFDAHRLVHLGAERGRQDAVKERFLRGYMSEGEPIGQHQALRRMAIEAGLDEAEVSAVLASDTHAQAVRADEAEAMNLGIRGVPFFVIDGRYGISGAQPADLLVRALAQAFTERPQAPQPVAEGEACGPDGCAPT